MPYVAPYIDAAGLHIPSYDDILQDNITKFKDIYGQDIYLGEDSADYQMISVFSLRVYDCMQTLQLVYNNRSPQTGVGAALDALLKLNGLKRKKPSASTCVVTITGDAGTIINNGVVSDVNGKLWNLPVMVTIGGGGTVDVTVTCQTIGAIIALAGEINSIATPTAGWTSVTNVGAAITGQAVETDAAARYRQSISVKLPSSTLLAGTVGAIASLTGVTRYRVYENPTDAVDANGLPRHSFSVMVEGGDDNEIADVIYNNRGIGPGMNGTTTVNITDPETEVVTAVKFSRPPYTQIYNILEIHPLTGWTTALSDLVKQAVVDYENSLQIGEDVTVSAVYAAAMSEMPDLKRPAYSIRAVKIGVAPAPGASNDIAIDYDKVAQTDLAKVTITEV